RGRPGRAKPRVTDRCQLPGSSSLDLELRQCPPRKVGLQTVRECFLLSGDHGPPQFFTLKPRLCREVAWFPAPRRGSDGNERLGDRQALLRQGLVLSTDAIPDLPLAGAWGRGSAVRYLLPYQ